MAAPTTAPPTYRPAAPRRAMMQTWADYLDQLRVGVTTIPLHAKAA